MREHLQQWKCVTSKLYDKAGELMNLAQHKNSTIMMIAILALIVLGAIFKGVAVFTGAFLFAYGAVPLLGALLYKATPAVWEEVHKEHKDNTEFSILKLLPDVTPWLVYLRR